MVARAIVRYVRISSRKVRAVVDLVRGKTTRQALCILDTTSQRSARVVQKLLRSAIANAKQRGVDDEQLVISRIFADEGPTWKRMRAMSFGRSGRIRKRTCHITLELNQKTVALRSNTVPTKSAAAVKKPLRRSPVQPAKKPKALPKKTAKQK